MITKMIQDVIQYLNKRDYDWTVVDNNQTYKVFIGSERFQIVFYYNAEADDVSKFAHQEMVLEDDLNDIATLHIYEFEVVSKRQREMIIKRLAVMLTYKTGDSIYHIEPIKMRRYMEFVKNHNLFEYYHAKAIQQETDSELLYWGMFDEHHCLQLVMIKNGDALTGVVPEYHFHYFYLIKRLDDFGLNLQLISNLEFGCYQTSDGVYDYEPFGLNVSRNNQIISDPDDQRIQRGQYHRIYNSGYQLINI